jgi:hypothetical protein
VKAFQATPQANGGACYRKLPCISFTLRPSLALAGHLLHSQTSPTFDFSPPASLYLSTYASLWPTGTFRKHTNPKTRNRHPGPKTQMKTNGRSHNIS